MSGFEISDVLAINDKDYSITFGLYFSRREEESGSTPPCEFSQVMSADPKAAMKETNLVSLSLNFRLRSFHSMSLECKAFILAMYLSVTMCTGTRKKRNDYGGGITGH